MLSAIFVQCENAAKLSQGSSFGKVRQMIDADHPVGWQTCFRDLRKAARIADVRLINDGWDCEVVKVGELVVRLPRRTEMIRVMRTEAVVLARLAPCLPVAVPVVERQCRQHGSMLYQWRAGQPMNASIVTEVGVDVVAGQLATAIAAVRSFPVGQADALGVSHRHLPAVVEHFREVVLPVLDLGSRPARLLDAAREALTDYTPTLTHGDLGAAHVLCGPRGVNAIIDWSDIAVSDPAVDAAWVLHTQEGRLRDAVLNHWTVDDDLVARAVLIHRLHPWWEVLYGLEHDRADLVASGVVGVDARLPL